MGGMLFICQDTIGMNNSTGIGSLSTFATPEQSWEKRYPLILETDGSMRYRSFTGDGREYIGDLAAGGKTNGFYRNF